jgi:hypothetical protein
MTSRAHRRILDTACVMALVALCLMIWSLLDPHPIPVILAMSAAQVLGTASLVAFLVVVADDVRRGERDVERGEAGEDRLSRQ